MEKVRKTLISVDDWIEESVEDEKEKSKLEKIKLFSKIASELIKYRIDNNMSQSDLAKKLDVTQNQVSKWERGMNDFKVGTLAKICKKLGLKLKVSLGVVEDEDENERKNSKIMQKEEWIKSPANISPAILFIEENEERYLDA